LPSPVPVLFYYYKRWPNLASEGKVLLREVKNLEFPTARDFFPFRKAEKTGVDLAGSHHLQSFSPRRIIWDS
jgi:hypothetical protein